MVLGTASFLSAHSLKLHLNDGSERTVSAPHIVVATGGEPTRPRIPGADLCITSDGFFDLEEQPKRVAIIGAGYIAVEMAGILHGAYSSNSTQEFSLPTPLLCIFHMGHRRTWLGRSSLFPWEHRTSARFRSFHH